MTPSKWAGIIVAVMINAAFVYFEVASVQYSDLFVSALTASWGFLGLTANSVRAQRKRDEPIA